jgi:hypothetical protein
MNRMILNWIALVATLLAPAAGFAQVGCTREGLEAETNLYIAAQGKGDTAEMPLAQGIACQTFTEVVVTDTSHPYVIGTRLRVNHDKIAEIESLVTQQGDWLFNADNYFKWSPGEDWGVIPAARRDSRGTLVAAANAYLDAFLEQKIDAVPWGYPCNRTEGGLHTGKGVPEDSCSVGVPAGVNIVARRFVVDENIGAVVAFCTFGVGGLPDTHIFRVENGKLRFVHTMTHVLPGRQVGRGGQGRGGAASNPN